MASAVSCARLMPHILGVQILIAISVHQSAFARRFFGDFAWPQSATDEALLWRRCTHMKSFFRIMISLFWPFLLLGAYLAYRGVIQYSEIPPSFSSFEEADAVAWRLKFPGIGLGFHVGESDRDGESIRAYSVELLFRYQYRVFVVAGKDKTFRLIDEFISAQTFRSVELRDGELRYLDSQGNVLFVHDPID